MTTQRDTASANLNAPGHVSIKRAGSTAISFWAWSMRAVRRSDKTGETQLCFRDDGMWLGTSASVDDVMVAVAAAMAAHNATYQRKERAA